MSSNAEVEGIGQIVGGLGKESAYQIFLLVLLSSPYLDSCWCLSRRSQAAVVQYIPGYNMTVCCY